MTGTTVDRGNIIPSSGRSYDNPYVQRLFMGDLDHGAGAAADSVPVPAGCKYGRVANVELSQVSEAFTDVTTGAVVRLGTSGDADAYFEGEFGAVAATDSADVADMTVTVDNLIDATSLTQVEVTYAAPTGGVPAGIANTHLTIHWW